MAAILFLGIAGAALLAAGVSVLAFVDVAFSDPPSVVQPDDGSGTEPAVAVTAAVEPDVNARIDADIEPRQAELRDGHRRRRLIGAQSHWFIDILLLATAGWFACATLT